MLLRTKRVILTKRRGFTLPPGYKCDNLWMCFALLTLILKKVSFLQEGIILPHLYKGLTVLCNNIADGKLSLHNNNISTILFCWPCTTLKRLQKWPQIGWFDLTCSVAGCSHIQVSFSNNQWSTSTTLESAEVFLFFIFTMTESLVQ